MHLKVERGIFTKNVAEILHGKEISCMKIYHKIYSLIDNKTFLQFKNVIASKSIAEF